MTSPFRRNRPLPSLLRDIDIPVPAKLRLAHAERIRSGPHRIRFGPSAHDLLRPLLSQSWGDPNRFELQLSGCNGGAELLGFDHWFFFDRGYLLWPMLDALEQPLNSDRLRMLKVVTKYPRAINNPLFASFLVKDDEALLEFGEKSPLFAWLACMACGQPPKEPWAYFFLPRQSPKGWRPDLMPWQRQGG